MNNTIAILFSVELVDIKDVLLDYLIRARDIKDYGIVASSDSGFME